MIISILIFLFFIEGLPLFSPSQSDLTGLDREAIFEKRITRQNHPRQRLEGWKQSGAEYKSRDQSPNISETKQDFNSSYHLVSALHINNEDDG